MKTIPFSKVDCSGNELKYVQEVIESGWLTTAGKCMEVLRAKYLRFKISYEGVARVETPEYPFEALREMIFNAFVHRDYAGATMQLRVYDDKLMLWNAGGLPADVNVLSLRGAHASRPRNARLADIFFRASFIEAWGRGTVLIVDSCRRMGVEVDFEECFGGFMVVLRKLKDKVTPLVPP